MRLKRANVEIVETNPDKIRTLKAEGYKELHADEGEKLEKEAVKDINSLSVKELRNLAKANGITVSNALRKQDIIELLEAGNDGNTETETAEEA